MNMNVTKMNSNTTLVKVKLLNRGNSHVLEKNSNTTLVKVKLSVRIPDGLDYSKFKYNSC